MATAVISTAITIAVILVAAAIAAATTLFGGSTAARVEEPRRRTHVVEIRKFKFAPKVLTVAPGDIIVWINKDIVPHTATAKDRGWDTGRIDAGAKARMVVTSKFFRGYLCIYHRSMTGRVAKATSQ